ncbi:thiosulfate:glutathione sulfurtransferase-like isoform X2 [Glandiceps talaboti]
MSLFRTLRVCRALSTQCKSRVFIVRNVGALSALQRIQIGDCGVSQELGHIHRVPDRTQQYNRYLSSEPDPDAPSIDHEGLVALLQSGDIQLVDVREPDELIDFGKIDKSYNIPLSRLTKSLEMNEANFIEQFGREKPMKWDINIVFYGMGPIRSRAAVELAHKYGYLKARHYPGGWEEWAEKTGVPFKKC